MEGIIRSRQGRRCGMGGRPVIGANKRGWEAGRQLDISIKLAQAVTPARVACRCPSGCSRSRLGTALEWSRGEPW